MEAAVECKVVLNVSHTEEADCGKATGADDFGAGHGIEIQAEPALARFALPARCLFCYKTLIWYLDDQSRQCKMQI